MRPIGAKLASLPMQSEHASMDLSRAQEVYFNEDVFVFDFVVSYASGYDNYDESNKPKALWRGSAGNLHACIKVFKASMESQKLFTVGNYLRVTFAFTARMASLPPSRIVQPASLYLDGPNKAFWEGTRFEFAWNEESKNPPQAELLGNMQANAKASA